MPVFGVLLPDSNVGDFSSPPSVFEVSGGAPSAMEESAAIWGDEVEAPRSGVLAPPSKEPRSFLSFFPFCLGCLSDEGVEVPLSLEEEMSAEFSPGALGGGVEGVDLLMR